MTVHVLIREDRNEHGYIDTSVIGVYRTLASAQSAEASQRERAVANGFDINYENPVYDSWQVYWKIEAIEVE